MVDRVTMRVERSSVEVGDSILVEGQVFPPLPLIPVTIFADSTVVARTFTEVGGVYKAWVVFRTKGKYSLRATADNVSSPPLLVEVWQYPPEGKVVTVVPEVIAPPTVAPPTAPPITLGELRSLLERVLSTFPRWGRDIELRWTHGRQIIAPPANTALVSQRVGSDRKGYIYGFSMTAGEGNQFTISWVSSGEVKSRVILLPNMGTVQHVDIIPLNEGAEADGNTTITIKNVNAGTPGKIYQASLLYGEI